ncbi:MAG: hypothetical protein IKQ95_06270 [Synergistaceae bacterium]|nr:hypothetical protein [Synergistaceae bacterium]
MKLAKYFLAVSVTAVICVFGMRWHYTGSFIQRQRAETDILNDTYYKIHISIYERMPSSEGGIVFLGDSITDYAPFSEIFFSSGLPVINRGIAGDNTSGALARVDEVISLKPSKLFILLGTNDIVYNMTAERTAENLTEIIRRVQKESPSTKIYVQTLMPTNPDLHTQRPNSEINSRNEKIIAVARETGCNLIDTNKHMAENGILPRKYTVDGLHLSGEGVLRWMEILAPHVKE